MSEKKLLDLEERTARFGERVLLEIKQLHINSTTQSILSQIVRSATSIGANYMEADGASSKKDFRNKLSIARKEAKETMHWLRMIAVVYPEKQIIWRELWKETHELVLIFSAILKRK